MRVDTEVLPLVDSGLPKDLYCGLEYLALGIFVVNEDVWTASSL